MGINSTEVSYGFGQLGSVYTTASSDAITPPTPLTSSAAPPENNFPNII